jgi:hypothetical protein
MKNCDPVDIRVNILAVTQKAYLVNNYDHDAWLPKSEILHPNVLNIESEIVITIPQWLADVHNFSLL